MYTFDPKLTRDLADWLNTPEDQRNIRAGADMMLSLNRNRALYNSIMRNPVKFAPKLVYELRKYLRMRIDEVTAADAAKIESEVIPRVEKTLSQPVISAEDDLPAAAIAKGKRADHDSLPPEIRALWEAGAPLLSRMSVLFNELKAMSDLQPCDRYEKVKLLGEADRTYRDNLARYDSYVLAPDQAHTSAADPEYSAEKFVPADAVKAVGAARKRISQYRKRLAALDENDPQRSDLLDKIQSAVDVILSCGSDLSETTRTELLAEGINFR